MERRNEYTVHRHHSGLGRGNRNTCGKRQRVRNLSRELQSMRAPHHRGKYETLRCKARTKSAHRPVRKRRSEAKLCVARRSRACRRLGIFRGSPDRRCLQCTCDRTAACVVRTRFPLCRRPLRHTRCEKKAESRKTRYRGRVFVNARIFLRAVQAEGID